MSGVLLDTNVLSELTRERPAHKVVAYVAGLDEAYLSVITLHEIRYGLALLPEGKRRTTLADAIQTLLNIYADRVLDIDVACAEIAAEMRAAMRQAGKSLSLADSLIAATAKARGLTVATRNTGDFEGLDVPLKDPFEA